MEIKQKSFIITGGANGLGKSIALNLEEAGAKVIVLDLDKSALSEINKNPHITGYQCDLTNFTQLDEVLKRVFTEHDRIDGLINNAGVLYSEPLLNILSKEKRHSLEGWEKTLTINLKVPFVIGSYVAEHMVLKRVKGVIVNISSVSALGNAGQSAYSASKAGLESMTKVWAKELGSFGIRCIAVAPGFINAESTHHAVNKKIVEHVKTQTPLKKLGNELDIAKAVQSSIENDFINATTIRVDGGLIL